MRKIKTNDDVIVTTGKFKSKVGKVTKVLFEKNKISKVVVEGINLAKKHVKPNPQKNQTGGIVEKEAPISISNVAIYNHMTKKADKVGIKVLEDGTKVRVFKSSGEQITV